jgi:adenosine kinase
MHYSQLLVFGSIAQDEIMIFPGKFSDHLEKDDLDKVNAFFLVENLYKAFGGIATNICYNISLLSSKKVRILGGIGGDGKDLLEFYHKNNIDTTYLQQSIEVYTGAFRGISDQNQNQIGGFYYGSNSLSKNIILKEIPDWQTSLLILSSNEPTAFYEILEQAINLKMNFMFDPGMAITWILPEKLKAGIDSCKYLIANDYEMMQIWKLTGYTEDDLIKKNKIVITTKGSKGVRFVSSEESYELPAFPIKDFVDPTGGGDAFRGGFCAALMDGLDTKTSLGWGSVMGSKAVETKGAVGHTITKEEFQTRLDFILANSN